MKKIYCCLPLLLLFIFNLTVKAHDPVAEEYVRKKMLEMDPDYLAKREAMEVQLQKRIAKNRTKRSQNTTYTIPIVIHVVHTGEAIGVGHNISDAQVLSGIDQLNAAFANTPGNGVDIGIQFELAKIDPNCASTNGINRIDGSSVSGYSTSGVRLNSSGADEQVIKALSKWDNSSYYNVWIVSEFDNNNGGSGTQGFAYFPGASSAVDGAMVMNSAWGDQGTANFWNNKGTTMIHEMGHALDLYHTFEGDNSGNSCPAQTNGCGSDIGDCCADTDPHIRSQSDCRTGQTNSCTGAVFSDVINNYMDYSDQDCQDRFTSDQKARMRAALETQRTGLITSNALSTGLAGFVAPKAATCTPATDPNWGLAGGYSGIMFAEIEGVVSHVSTTASQDGGYIDETGSCIKTATLEVGGTYKFKTEIWLNPGQAVAWIDYNNDGAFTTNEKIYDKSMQGDVTDSANFTIPQSATTGAYLRMRVLCDLNPISDACHDPQYGQAEDYPVLLSAATSSRIAAESSEISVSPNPFSNQITINGVFSSSAYYTIVDVTGKTVSDGIITNVGSSSIATTHVGAGSYVLNIFDGNKVISKKLIKL